MTNKQKLIAKYFLKELINAIGRGVVAIAIVAFILGIVMLADSWIYGPIIMTAFFVAIAVTLGILVTRDIIQWLYENAVKKAERDIKYSSRNFI